VVVCGRGAVGGSARGGTSTEFARRVVLAGLVGGNEEPAELVTAAMGGAAEATTLITWLCHAIC
jgi:hypothetical protein